MTSTATDQITGFSGSLAVKQPVRLATLVDIVLEGLIAIDGIVPAEGDRVLVKAQATPSQNGIYIASTGVWSRAADFDATGKAVKGTQVWVTDGTTQAGTLWIVSAANPIVIDTSALTWQAGNAYQAGAAMAAAIIAATSKSTPVAADRIGYVNSVDNSLVQMTWAQMMAALLPGAAASSFVRRNAGNTAYEHRSAAQTLSDIGAVAKAGDTMTGDLVIAKTQPNLVLLKAASGSNNLISGYTSSNARWQIALGDSTAEGGANAGSDISIYRFADNGAFLDTPFQLVRATGAMNLNSGQLQFPATQNPSSDANTLDDYEEGTWTPTIAFGGASVGITYSGRGGSYVKVGRLLFLDGNFTLTSKGSSTGEATMLAPFSYSTEPGGVLNFAANFASITGSVILWAQTTALKFRMMGTTGAIATGLSDTHFANNTAAFFSIVGRVSQ